MANKVITRNRVLPWVAEHALYTHTYPTNKEYLDVLFQESEKDNLGSSLQGIHSAYYRWRKDERKRREQEERRRKRARPVLATPVETRPLEEALSHALNAIAEVEIAAKSLLHRHEQLRKLLGF